MRVWQEQDFEQRTRQLRLRYGVGVRAIDGAYQAEPLRSTEILLHELAHWQALGHSDRRIPRNLTRKVSEQMGRLSREAANALELDTALITWGAGYRLGLLYSPEPIFEATYRNLKGIRPYRDVVLELQRRWLGDPLYEIRSQELALLYGPDALPVSMGGIRQELQDVAVSVQ